MIVTVSPPSRMFFGVRFFLLLSLALPFLAAAQNNLAPAIPPERPLMPVLQVRGGERGAEAIRALGDKLPEVAAHYRKTEAELRDMFRRDHDLQLDPRGRLCYVCEGLVAPAGGDAGAGDEPLPQPLAPLDQTFFLHSKPNSTRKIFLDFDGHLLTNNAWTSKYNGGTNIVAPAWSKDNDPTTFNTEEQTIIQQVWLRVAEDYAPFDVDVTTEYPGEAALTRANSSDQNYGMRALISPISSYIGNYGGIAYVGAFDDVGDYYKPALIFPEKLSNNEKNIAEAISHEVGHTLGLSHDGTSTVEYYSGQGNWAPIMGTGYSKPIVQWSRGEYANANNTQDDYVVIQQNGLVYRTDDHGDLMGNATALTGLNATNTGILERTNDVDFFSCVSSAGVATFRVTPWERGANVHFLLSLYDAGGTLLTNRQVADTTAGVQPVVIQRTLAAGTYYFSVAGVGVGDPLTTGYSSYGCRGNYTVSVNLPAAPIVAMNPTNLTLTVVGDLMRLDWPADHIGWRLEAQTNAAGAGLSSNWANVTGAAATNRVFVPRTPTGGSVFFRLAYP